MIQNYSAVRLQPEFENQWPYGVYMMNGKYWIRDHTMKEVEVKPGDFVVHEDGKINVMTWDQYIGKPDSRKST